MKNIISLLILLILSITYKAFAYNDEVRNILNELDNVIENKKEYYKKHEEKIEQLKIKLRNTTNIKYKFELCDTIFAEYLHYQADSALLYANMGQKYIEKNNEYQKNYILLNRAEAFAVMGMYTESFEQLLNINKKFLNKELRLNYYMSMRTYYGWVSEYTPQTEEKTKYIKKTNIYRDSILLELNDKVDRDINNAEKFILKNNPDSAISILIKRECSGKINLRQIASLYYTLYMAYKLKGDTEKQIYYLAKSAIADLKAPVREYASLQRLALLVYQQGNTEKGYKYLINSMEDAVDCNARLRYIEVTEFYPAINKAYKIKEEQKQRVITITLVIVVILSLMLVVAIFYLYRWMKKLSLMRKELYKANKDLIQVNKSLKEAGKIKEIYIMKYLDRCVNYLEKLEQYRRSLEKLSMASKSEELHKAIRSGQFIRDEKKNFYVDFDKSFLAIFPNFVKDFNNLLKEEEQITLKPGEMMNTEIRIFALIRLGVTDANSIAHFLGCSLATVYNYRSKIRNRAKDETASFEQSVMEL